ncbi:MAG: hypothetical protein KC443_02985 [Anaerolineales bacterium]|nr:hypothetical protein [Anaerolineales bacterium]
MRKKNVRVHYWSRLLISLLLLALAACQQETPAPEVVEVPTQIPTISLVTEPEVVAVEPTRQPPSTWTPQPTEPPPPTSTALPTVTAVPTDTPAPIPTNTPVPTDTPVPTETPIPPTNTPAPVQPTAPPAEPTIPVNPVLGANLLPNGSFENGWYNQNGIPELQLPNEWLFEWDEGPTGFGNQSWDVYVRPETRVLPSSQLPPAEHPLYIYDGSYTVKMFKGSGAVSFRLWTNVTLEPGTYVFEINVYPDLVMGYTENREKIWADDPNSGEVRLWAGDRSTDWLSLSYGQRNTRNYTFTIDQTKTIEVGVWARGRYAIPNNGFFFDAWSLKRVES